MMTLFIKANSASIIASSVDYLVALLLNKVILWSDFYSSITGTVAGGVVNFLICRDWVFDNKDTSNAKLAVRYTLVWAGNLVLNMFGVYVLLHLGLPMLTAKIIISVTVAFAYNYPLQKNYVFRNK
jgi:putative flippase GtrA